MDFIHVISQYWVRLELSKMWPLMYVCVYVCDVFMYVMYVYMYVMYVYIYATMLKPITINSIHVFSLLRLNPKVDNAKHDTCILVLATKPKTR